MATLGLLIGFVGSALAQSKTRSLLAICAGNLRSIGQAFQVFNAENGADPWRSSWGRNPESGLRQNSWFQFLALSNSLPNPRVLACPSDEGVRPARDYSFSPDGGFLNPRQMNNSISYAVGLDSLPLLPSSVLAVDRHLRFDSLSGACSTGHNPVSSINSGPFAPSGWGETLHGPAGNLLMQDGRVESASPESVRYWLWASDDNGSLHFLPPKLLLMP